MERNEGFRPKLARDVQIRFFKRDERGRFYIIGRKNEKSYLKVHEVGRDIVEMLDGDTSVGDIEENLRAKDVEVDLSRFIKLLGERGFLENKQVLEKQHRTSSFMLHRIPLFKRTDPILDKIYSVSSKFFRRKVFLSLISVNLAIFLIFLAALSTGYIQLDDFFFIGNSVFFAVTIYLLLIMPFLVVIHELAHGIMCFHYGGRPQEIGLAFFFFIPFFYIDTTDTWMLNKKQSTMVFLAGPVSTFFIGNFFFVLSLLLPTQYINPLRMVAFGSYLVVLMGFNPVVGSDGYYILQALTDFPNLSSHAWRYVSMWCKRVFSLISMDSYKEYVTSYSRREKSILNVYAPFVLAINVALFCLMGYWGVFFANDLWKNTLSIIETVPNIPAISMVIWIMQLVYMILIVYFLFTISKSLIERSRAKDSEI